MIPNNIISLKNFRGYVCSLLILFIIQIGFLDESPVSAQAPTQGEVKAAFIYNFTKFVQWPKRSFAGSQTPINICAIGAQMFIGQLEELESKTVRGRPIKVRLIGDEEDKSSALSCHLLFVDGSQTSQLPGILAALQGGSVLTVGDIDRFAESGGMIGLEKAGRKIRIAINLSAVKKSGLTISSRLLRLARIVGADERKRGGR